MPPTPPKPPHQPLFPGAVPLRTKPDVHHQADQDDQFQHEEILHVQGLLCSGRENVELVSHLQRQTSKGGKSERSGARRIRRAPPGRVNPPSIGAGILGRCLRTFLTARDPGRRTCATSDAAPSRFPPLGRSGLNVCISTGLDRWLGGSIAVRGRTALASCWGGSVVLAPRLVGVRRVRVGAG